MKEVNVHIGEIKIAKKGETLKTILGSCVGIGMLWKNRGICGLVHCLLPEMPEQSFAIDGRYVNQAIPALMAMMKIREENVSEITVIVAGGGNMTSAKDAPHEQLVGFHNAEMAMRELKKRGFKVLQNDTGGEEGRKITIFSESFTFLIEPIPRIVATA